MRKYSGTVKNLTGIMEQAVGMTVKDNKTVFLFKENTFTRGVA